jgi:predicted transcriptional regulator
MSMAKKFRPRPIEKPLTPTELEVMNIVWSHENCSAHQVVEKLPPEHQLAYTSVSSVVRILEKKGFLDSVTTDRTHLYTAKISKESYQHRTLDKLVSSLFEGKPSQLVLRLLELKQTGADEMQEMRNLLRVKK